MKVFEWIRRLHHQAWQIEELEYLVMTDQETIDALAARINVADEKVAALEVKSIADDKVIADLQAKLAALPPVAAPLDFSGATKAVDGLEAALIPPVAS